MAANKNDLDEGFEEVTDLDPGFEEVKPDSWFEENVVDQLPGLGGLGGALVGGAVGIPGGPLGISSTGVAGAGIGGFAGKALQNMYNNQFRPERAPKAVHEYLTGPIVEGTENALIEAAMGPAGLVGKAALKGVGRGAGKIASSPVGRKVGESLSRGKNAVSGLATKVASQLTHIPEQSIKTYAEDPAAINAMYKEFGGDVSQAADSARERVQKKIQSTMNKHNTAISSSLEASKGNPLLGDLTTDPVISRLERAKGKLDPRVREDREAIVQIDDLIQQVKDLSVGEEGAINPYSMHRSKQILQDAAQASYDAAGKPIFKGGPQAASAARGGAAEARILTNNSAPAEYAVANKELERLRRLNEHRASKNLLKPREPEGALITAGSGTNQRNARFLKMIDEATGASITKDAQQLGAMRDFGNPSFFPNDTTGKTVARILGGGAAGGVLSGGDSKGVVAGAALSSPAVIKQLLNLNAKTRGALGRFAPIIENAAARGSEALATTLRVLSRTPEFQQALDKLNSEQE